MTTLRPLSPVSERATELLRSMEPTSVTRITNKLCQRIKAVSNETKLLLVDKHTDDYYRGKKIVIRGDMPNVQRIEGPSSRDNVDGGQRESRASSASSDHSGTINIFSSPGNRGR